MHVLGIDIGGSGIKGATVDLTTGKLTAERLCVATPLPADTESIARTVAGISRHFTWQGAIGCGLPAVVQHGVVKTAANIDPCWIETNAAQLFSETCEQPVTVINDADAAGLAEMRFGAGKDHGGTIILITVGTGLGTALFRDGRLTPNTELGHLQLDGQDAEKVASARVRTEQQLSFRDWAMRFDNYLHQLEALLWPDLFIIGGEISRDHASFFPFLTIKTRIVPAALRNDAGIIGAAMAACA